MLNKIIEKIHNSIERKKREFIVRALEFADNRKGAMVIIADESTDLLVVSYKKKYIATQIKSEDGKKLSVVKKLLKRSRMTIFDKNMNTFLLALDGAIFNLSKAKVNKSKLKNYEKSEEGEKSKVSGFKGKKIKES